MFSNPLTAFGKTSYAQTGNLLGHDGSALARISDKARRYNAMHITGSEADRTDWVIEQALQDIDRQNLVVLRDPKGLATAEIIARAGKAFVKNAVWIDLDSRERLIPLSPFPSHQPEETSFVPQWERALLDALQPLSGASARTMQRLLQMLYAANGSEDYLQPSFTTFWLSVVMPDYRRMLLSHVPTAFWRLMPDEKALLELQQDIGPKLAELFAVNQWRGTLTLPDPTRACRWDQALQSHPNKQVQFIAITGAAEHSDPVIQAAVNFALWRKITAWQVLRDGLPVYAYSLSADFFASPAVTPLLHGAPAKLSVTCAQNDPQDWLHYELTGHLSQTGHRIAVEDSRGASVTLKRKPALPAPNYALAKISRKYSTGVYARNAEFPLMEQQALFGKEDGLADIYEALGQLPPHFMKAA